MTNPVKCLCLLLFLFLFQTALHARHIIGGVLTYECLGDNNYRFTLKMYRDCAGGGAGFDQNAAFSIYKGNSQTPITTLFRGIQSIENIEPTDDPCLELPPNVCVQEGVYVFSYRFAEWPSNESYHVSYQRCCRNESITNLRNPGSVGATFTVEITPASQAVCNSSPVYNTFPPIVICVNEPLIYDHSAFDADGDQLVYEFCSPILGGGLGGAGGPGGPNTCTGVSPNPACPPPYTLGSFVNPPYSPLNPMGGSPPVTINPVTGLVTGTPNILGQFVVVVCVKEYRNGQLLSVIRRDVQFNVANCEPLIFAKIDGEDLSLEDGEYIVRTCNGLKVPFQNQSTIPNNITDWRWEFYMNDSVQVHRTWDATATFPAPGNYKGALLLNPNSDCSDTAKISIEIFPELVAAFDYAYDTCVAGPVGFVDLSHINGSGQITSFKWSFGDGDIDTIQHNPVHVYDEPKVAGVKLQVWDEHGCVDDSSRAVVYKPVPALILVRPNDTVSCAPATLFFNNLSNPVDQTYSVKWGFGDGETGDDISPTHTYKTGGQFDVKLEITSPIGCYIDTIFENLVRIFPPPVAGFYFDPTDPSNFTPVVDFYDQSIDAVHWDWYVDDRLVSQDPDFTFSFPDTGLHQIKLIITRLEKCQDTLVQTLDVTPKVTFFLPNAFTPNEDTVNDFFQGTGVTRGVTDFHLEIWDRYGEKIFETSDPDEAWNGQIHNTDRPAQAGVYITNVKFTGPRGEPFEYKGFTTLIR